MPLTAFMGWYAGDFGLDASADSLTLERDEGLGHLANLRAGLRDLPGAQSGGPCTTPA